MHQPADGDDQKTINRNHMSSSINEFDQLYNDKILPALKNAERIRKKIFTNYAIIGTVVFIGLAIEAVTWMSLALVVVILFVLFYTRWYGIPTTEYDKAYINAITWNTINYLAPALVIDNSSHLKLSELQNTLLITGQPEYFSGKNLIHGNIDSNEIKISEIYSRSKIKKPDGSESVFEYFNGLVLVSNIRGNGNTLICTDNALYENYADFGAMIRMKENAEGITVVSDRDESATEAPLRSIKNYFNVYRKNVMYSSSESGTALAVINPKGFSYFEPSVLRSAINKKTAETYFRDMQFLIKTITEPVAV